MQHSASQVEFLKGNVPVELPNGFLKGGVNLKTDWQGKEFEVSSGVGINVFKKDGKEFRAYPFKFYKGKGLQEPKLDVIKIDYSQTQPFWARFILDEIVEVSDGKYLGKIHLTVVPGTSLVIGYFRLEK